jgi:hypothetical protein
MPSTFLKVQVKVQVDLMNTCTFYLKKYEKLKYKYFLSSFGAHDIASLTAIS